MSMKKSNDTIGNRTRNLPVCSTVPQPLRHTAYNDFEGVFINSASYLPDRIQTTEHLLHVHHNKTIDLEELYQMLWLNCKRYILSAFTDLIQ
jgi:hypothetical protein